MANTYQKSHKAAALFTYAITLICLLAGWFLPLVGTGFEVENMLALQLPDVLNKTFRLQLDMGNPFLYSYPIELFGVTPEFDLGAWIVLLYALVTVIGLICLIPAIAGSNEKRTSMNVAFVIEALAAFVLGILILMQIQMLWAANANDIALPWSWNLTIAFGGALLMMIIQRMVCSGGSGVIKTVLFLLSSAAVLFAVFPVQYVITSLADPLSKLAGDNLVVGIYGLDGASGSLISQVTSFFHYNYFADIFPMIAGGKSQAMAIFTLILGLIVLINFMLDMLGIAKRTNKFMLVCNQIRYVIELLALIGVIIMVFVAGYTFGLMLILLAILAVIQYIINLVRLIKYSKAKALAASEAVNDDYPYYDELEDEGATANAAVAEPLPEATTTTPEPQSDSYVAAALPAPAATVTEPTTVVETRNVIYNVQTIYNGPSDSFINKLTNNEKIEFAKVFLERSQGNLSVIPDYKVGGENSKFFSCVIIYYSRVRDLVSDGLMNKLYQEGKMM